MPPTTRQKVNNFVRARARIKRDAAEFNLSQGKEIVKIARRLCPVSDNNDPGHVHLRDTIRTEKGRRQGEVKVIAGDESQGVFHALPVEEGYHTQSGSFVEGQPYMRPAIEQVRKRARRRRAGGVL